MAKKVSQNIPAKQIIRNRVQKFADPTLRGNAKRKELPPGMKVPSREERGGHPFERP